MSADADPAAAAADLRLALEQAFAAQQARARSDADGRSRFVGVSPPPEIADAAAESYLAERAAATAPTAPAPARSKASSCCRSRSSTSSRRSTISVRRCWPPPESTRRRVSFGVEAPRRLAASLDDAAETTASGALQVGDRSLAVADRAGCRRLVAGLGRSAARADGRPTSRGGHRRLVPADRSRRRDLRGRRLRDCRSPATPARPVGDADVGVVGTGRGSSVATQLS